MPAKRKYNVKGTNDFLVLGLIFFFLCLWAIRDAWYPSEKTLKKHPLSIDASFETAGSVGEVFVEVDESVAPDQVIATLRTDKMEEEFEEAKNRYTETKDKNMAMQLALKNARANGASNAGIQEISDSASSAKTAMDEALEKVTELRKTMDLSELKSPSKGKVLEVKAGPHSMVEAGETVIVIDPKDHFYLFNKSLAIFSFFAFWIFLIIHFLAR
jgi:multidrug resistance efflux pump